MPKSEYGATDDAIWGAICLSIALLQRHLGLSKVKSDSHSHINRIKKVYTRGKSYRKCVIIG